MEEKHASTQARCSTGSDGCFCGCFDRWVHARRGSGRRRLRSIHVLAERQVRGRQGQASQRMGGVDDIQAGLVSQASLEAQKTGPGEGPENAMPVPSQRRPSRQRAGSSVATGPPSFSGWQQASSRRQAARAMTEHRSATTATLLLTIVPPNLHPTALTTPIVPISLRLPSV
jgi:hypothetical protein